MRQSPRHGGWGPRPPPGGPRVLPTPFTWDFLTQGSPQSQTQVPGEPGNGHPTSLLGALATLDPGAGFGKALSGWGAPSLVLPAEGTIPVSLQLLFGAW